MQELRLVLIIVGGLAIAALLFHGLWTSKKEGKTKFGDKPLGKLAEPEDELAAGSDDDFDVIRKEPSFGLDTAVSNTDPLLGSVDDVVEQDKPQDSPAEEEVLPSFSTIEPEDIDEPTTPSIQVEKVEPQVEESVKPAVQPTELNAQDIEQPIATPEATPEEDELEVIVLNVHAAGDGEFIGTQLFDSMQQNGLLYGEMDIFHRHADLSGTGKVLFSVANMMQPGTLAHGDPAEFSTKGISFFMTLPCFGDAEQNFKLMLRTAQQIADDLGGHVLDDKRNLMTPNRQDAYRKQVQDFKAKKAS